MFNHLPTNFNNQKVLLRADLNVPIAHGMVFDDFRLQQTAPTIDQILQRNGTVILATHIGRPHGRFVPELSTKVLLPWFIERGYNSVLETDWQRIKETQYPAKTIILLENLRFFAGEQQQDHHFAQELASLATYYVNDAFATLHRNDTSITLVPMLFAPDHRFLGPLIQKELAMLTRLRENPEKPYIALIGGGKVATKIPLLEQLVNTATTVILMPAIVFTFCKAQGKSVGKSLVDQESIPEINELITQHGNIFVYPSDYLVAINSWQGPLRIFKQDELPQTAVGVSVGPESIAGFEKILMTAKTIFLNAASYFPARPETMEPLVKLLHCIAQSPAFCIVAGGESVAAVRKAGLENKISYLSTGGGASLAYLSGQLLPGLKPFQSPH